MDKTIIRYPVHTLAGNELLAAGESYSAATMKSVISATAADKHRYIKLMAYDTIERDLKDLLTQPPYDIIFAENELREDMLSLVNKVTVPLPMLDAMDYFKEYDLHTYKHMLIIYALSMLLAGEFDPSGAKRILLSAVGPSHDLGKINVPINILTKSQPLTNAEKDHLQHHAMAGYIHLSSYYQDTNSNTARIARDHHERLDGSGYPQGIRQQDPLVEIIAIADMYDALISPRPYRPESYDNRTAIEELTRLAEQGQISWDILKLLVVFNREDKPHDHSFDVSLEKRGAPPAENSYGKSADPESNPGWQ